ncbi:MAG: hypothetical protein IPO89_13710 [Actinomycetales bacterium]|nr:hypothetical protein [Candidatus Lutibacillus vidarii]
MGPGRGAAERAAAAFGVVAVGREEGEGMPRAVSLAGLAEGRRDLGARHRPPSPKGATISAVAAGGRGHRRGRLAAHRRRGGRAPRRRPRRGPDGDAAVAVIACGERWPRTPCAPRAGGLVGAGAVLDALAALVGAGALSPDARAAAAYRGCAPTWPRRWV